MLGFLKPKKKNYPSTSTVKGINELREGMVEVMEEIYAQEGRKPTRSEIRKKFDANYVAISYIRDEWWATIEPEITDDDVIVEDAVLVSNEDALVATGMKTLESDSTPKLASNKSIEEQVEEAYQKGLSEGKEKKSRTKTRVRVPNLN